MAHHSLLFALHISADEYQRYYQGSAKSIATTTVDGRNIKFPANILRPFVTHEGIRGQFKLEYDENSKFVAIKRVL